MLKTTENVVVIPQEYETWLGILSLSRVRELLSVGVTKKAIAIRFRVSVQSIDKAFAKERNLTRKKVLADTRTEATPEKFGDSTGMGRDHVTANVKPNASGTPEGGE